MTNKGSSWLKFGLFTVGLGQSFVFVIVPPLARDLGLDACAHRCIEFHPCDWNGGTFKKSGHRHNEKLQLVPSLTTYDAHTYYWLRFFLQTMMTLFYTFWKH